MRCFPIESFKSCLTEMLIMCGIEEKLVPVGVVGQNLHLPNKGLGSIM